MKLDEALAELERADALLAKMESYVPPELKEAARDWVENKSLDDAIGAAVGIAYPAEARKKDRQRLIPIAAVIEVLAQLEDDTVSASVLGPWKQGLRQLKGPFVKAGLALQAIGELTAAEWKHVQAEMKILGEVWDSIDGNVLQKTAAVFGAYFEGVSRQVKRAMEAAKNPWAIASEVFIAMMSLWTVATIRAQVAKVLEARAEARLAMPLRALPQPSRKRAEVHKRTRA